MKLYHFLDPWQALSETNGTTRKRSIKHGILSIYTVVAKIRTTEKNPFKNKVRPDYSLNEGFFENPNVVLNFKGVCRPGLRFGVELTEIV